MLCVCWLIMVGHLVSSFASAAGPVSVASINLCADQLVLLLADQSQIKTLSNLSHQEAGSYFYKRAGQYPVNKGSAEKILALNPHVVIVGQYSNAHTVKLLREVGLRVETLPIANNLNELYENITHVSEWLGKADAGLKIVTDLKERVSKLVNTNDSALVAAVFDPNGYTNGFNTLRGQMMKLAGWQNAASIAGIESYGKLTLEEIIRLSPDALIESPYSPGTYSRAQVMSRHPALLEAGLKPRVIHIPSRMMICAGPWTVDVIERLQAERLKLAKQRG